MGKISSIHWYKLAKPTDPMKSYEIGFEQEVRDFAKL